MQWQKEKGQTMQWLKEKGQTMQWQKEKGQTMQWQKEKGQDLFFFLPLHCLSFFNLQLQITNLVSSNFYYITLLLLFNHNRVRVMVFIATFNNISAILWQSVLLVE
jgi:hypothetical protein